MENEVKEAMSTAFSVIMISLVITMAVAFTNLSYKAYNVKIKTDAVNYTIKVKSELYNYFINPDEDLSGVDIIDFITIHDKAYRYIIVTDKNTYKLSKGGLVNIPVSGIVTTKDADDKFWTQSYMLDNILKGVVYDKFKGTIVNDSGDVVKDISEINGDVWLRFELIIGG